MSLAERIRRVAEAEIGVTESAGPNDGPRIREYQAAVKPLPLPLGHHEYAWCAAFCVWVYRQAGIEAQWVTAHTGTACNNANRLGLISDAPRPGALLCWCGTHVGILIEPLAEDLWRTIEGNSSNAVQWRTRSLKDAKILVPADLMAEPADEEAARRYWVHDPGAAPAKRWYGPWLSKDARDRALKLLSQRLERRLRACSFYGAFDPKTGRVIAAADPMGQTRGEDRLDSYPDVGPPEDPPTTPSDVPAPDERS